jgi:hypothetical protein
MHMRVLPILIASLFLAGTVHASQAKVQSHQSNWTKIKELFK